MLFNFNRYWTEIRFVCPPCRYTTSPSVQSSWSHPTPITDLDISVFAVFALQIIVDLLLIYGAIKRIHSQTVPWLCANSVVMGIMLVIIRAQIQNAPTEIFTIIVPQSRSINASYLYYDCQTTD